MNAQSDERRSILELKYALERAMPDGPVELFDEARLAKPSFEFVQLALRELKQRPGLYPGLLSDDELRPGAPDRVEDRVAVIRRLMDCHGLASRVSFCFLPEDVVCHQGWEARQFLRAMAEASLVPAAATRAAVAASLEHQALVDGIGERARVALEACRVGPSDAGCALRTIEDAWAVLRYLFASESRDEAGALDLAIARFAIQHPGELESRLILPEWLAQLEEVLPRVHRYRGNILGIQSVFDAQGPIRQTLQTIGPRAALGAPMAAEALKPGSFFYTWIPAVHFAQATLLEDPGYLDDGEQSSWVPPEIRDWLKAAVARFGSGTSRRSFPDSIPGVLRDILPHESSILEMAPDQVTHAVAEYRRMDSSEFEASLRPRGLSHLGFLDSSTGFGETVLADARTLLVLGVSRRSLADAIDTVVRVAQCESLRQAFGERAPPSELTALEAALAARTGIKPDAARVSDDEHFPWIVSKTGYCGHQQDPFHANDTYDFHGLGAGDCTIESKRTGARCTIPDLLPYLIRRACFFEAGPYRVEPLQLCQVMHLV